MHIDWISFAIVGATFALMLPILLPVLRNRLRSVANSSALSRVAKADWLAATIFVALVIASMAFAHFFPENSFSRLVHLDIRTAMQFVMGIFLAVSIIWGMLPRPSDGRIIDQETFQA